MTEGFRSRIEVTLEIDGFPKNPLSVHELSIEQTVRVVGKVEESKRDENKGVRLEDPLRKIRVGSNILSLNTPRKKFHSVPRWVQVIGLIISIIGTIASLIACFQA